MGLTLLSVLEIQSNGENIKCSASGPVEGKYAGWIELWRDGHLHKPIISTNPTFDSADDARAYVEGLVVEIRKIDLSNPPDGPTEPAEVVA